MKSSELKPDCESALAECKRIRVCCSQFVNLAFVVMMTDPKAVESLVPNVCCIFVRKSGSHLLGKLVNEFSERDGT